MRRFFLNTKTFLALPCSTILALTLAPASGRPPPFPGVDKLAHLGLFAVWGLILAASRVPWRGALALGLALAAATEGGQALLDAWLAFGRHAEVLDALADLAGLALGLGAAGLKGPRARPGVPRPDRGTS